MLFRSQVISGEEISLSKKQTKAVVKETPIKTKVAASKNESTEDFGLEHKKIEKSGDKMTAQVVKVKKRPHGELVIELNNGHIWHQIGSDYFRVKVGDNVAIKRGVFNSFTMRVDGSNKGIKVKRK